MGPRPASPHPQLPAPPFPGDLPPQGDPSLSSRGSPPPQRLLFSNPGSLHPPASLLPSTFFISPSLASRHLLRAPTLPAQTLLFPQTCLQCPLLPPIPIFHLSHLCSNGGLASASLHLSSSSTRTPASSPGLGRLPPRSMPPGGLPRWAREKGPSLAPALGWAAKGGPCGSDRCLQRRPANSPPVSRTGGRTAGSGPGWANSNPEARGTEGCGCVCYGRGRGGRAGGDPCGQRTARRSKVSGRTGPRPEKLPPSPPAIHCTSTRLGVYCVLGANAFHQASLLTPVLCNPTSIY